MCGVSMDTRRFSQPSAGHVRISAGEQAIFSVWAQASQWQHTRCSTYSRSWAGPGWALRTCPIPVQAGGLLLSDLQSLYHFHKWSAWIPTQSDIHRSRHNSCTKNTETRHTLSTALGGKDVPMHESLVVAIPLSTWAAVNAVLSSMRRPGWRCNDPGSGPVAHHSSISRCWSLILIHITLPPHTKMLEMPELSIL